ncbi:amyloid fiber anchoring/assembly protein TapA [Bacillus tianshenii]|uniref:amyloid fiber anchoring/assembly protein TapA n=1 Tax=Sutcliffiella tianshenii TaxID=1463404 RepID=UPI001CD6DC44|nr:amyloid fiber anchoring/assembly protein TapA [Bacillus tianshenii]MCA1319646.1 amyloid fiber anchoring/assembly protein TapA [Bacillus tianshenii]
MNVIRHMRIHKFKKKNLGYILVAKSTAIILLISIGIIYLTGNTGAYFNDNSTTTGTFTAGFWETVKEAWDKSSLNFLNENHDQVVAACGPTAIGTILKNTGENMQGQTEYYVFYKENGNPMQGEQVGEGIIHPIEHNQTGTIQFEVSEAGNYKFKALQRPGHGNKEDERHVLWSETITLNCEQPAGTEEKNDESESLKEESTSESNQADSDSETESQQEAENTEQSEEANVESDSSKEEQAIDNNNPESSDSGNSGGE